MAVFARVNVAESGQARLPPTIVQSTFLRMPNRSNDIPQSYRPNFSVKKFRGVGDIFRFDVCLRLNIGHLSVENRGRTKCDNFAL